MAARTVHTSTPAAAPGQTLLATVWPDGRELQNERVFQYPIHGLLQSGFGMLGIDVNAMQGILLTAVEAEDATYGEVNHPVAALVVAYARVCDGIFTSLQCLSLPTRPAAPPAAIALLNGLRVIRLRLLGAGVSAVDIRTQLEQMNSSAGWPKQILDQALEGATPDTQEGCTAEANRIDDLLLNRLQGHVAADAVFAMPHSRTEHLRGLMAVQKAVIKAVEQACMLASQSDTTDHLSSFHDLLGYNIPAFEVLRKTGRWPRDSPPVVVHFDPTEEVRTRTKTVKTVAMQLLLRNHVQNMFKWSDARDYLDPELLALVCKALVIHQAHYTWQDNLTAGYPVRVGSEDTEEGSRAAAQRPGQTGMDTQARKPKRKRQEGEEGASQEGEEKAEEAGIPPAKRERVLAFSVIDDLLFAHPWLQERFDKLGPVVGDLHAEVTSALAAVVCLTDDPSVYNTKENAEQTMEFLRNLIRWTMDEDDPALPFTQQHLRASSLRNEMQVQALDTLFDVFSNNDQAGTAAPIQAYRERATSTLQKNEQGDTVMPRWSANGKIMVRQAILTVCVHARRADLLDIILKHDMDAIMPITPRSSSGAAIMEQLLTVSWFGLARPSEQPSAPLDASFWDVLTKVDTPTLPPPPAAEEAPMEAEAEAEAEEMEGEESEAGADTALPTLVNGLCVAMVIKLLADGDILAPVLRTLLDKVQMAVGTEGTKEFKELSTVLHSVCYKQCSPTVLVVRGNLETLQVLIDNVRLFANGCSDIQAAQTWQLYFLQEVIGALESAIAWDTPVQKEGNAANVVSPVANPGRWDLAVKAPQARQLNLRQMRDSASELAAAVWKLLTLRVRGSSDDASLEREAAIRFTVRGGRRLKPRLDNPESAADMTTFKDTPRLIPQHIEMTTTTERNVLGVPNPAAAIYLPLLIECMRDTGIPMPIISFVLVNWMCTSSATTPRKNPARPFTMDTGSESHTVLLLEWAMNTVRTQETTTTWLFRPDTSFDACPWILADLIAISWSRRSRESLPPTVCQRLIDGISEPQMYDHGIFEMARRVTQTFMRVEGELSQVSTQALLMARVAEDIGHECAKYKEELQEERDQYLNQGRPVPPQYASTRGDKCVRFNTPSLITSSSNLNVFQRIADAARGLRTSRWDPDGRFRETTFSYFRMIQAIPEKGHLMELAANAVSQVYGLREDAPREENAASAAGSATRFGVEGRMFENAFQTNAATAEVVKKNADKWRSPVMKQVLEQFGTAKEQQEALKDRLFTHTIVIALNALPSGGTTKSQEWLSNAFTTFVRGPGGPYHLDRDFVSIVPIPFASAGLDICVLATALARSRLQRLAMAISTLRASLRYNRKDDTLRKLALALVTMPTVLLFETRDLATTSTALEQVTNLFASAIAQVWSPARDEVDTFEGYTFPSASARICIATVEPSYEQSLQGIVPWHPLSADRLLAKMIHETFVSRSDVPGKNCVLGRDCVAAAYANMLAACPIEPPFRPVIPLDMVTAEAIRIFSNCTFDIRDQIPPSLITCYTAHRDPRQGEPPIWIIITVRLGSMAAYKREAVHWRFIDLHITSTAPPYADDPSVDKDPVETRGDPLDMKSAQEGELATVVCVHGDKDASVTTVEALKPYLGLWQEALQGSLLILDNVPRAMVGALMTFTNAISAMHLITEKQAWLDHVRPRNAEEELEEWEAPGMSNNHPVAVSRRVLLGLLRDRP